MHPQYETMGMLTGTEWVNQSSNKEECHPQKTGAYGLATLPKTSHVCSKKLSPKQKKDLAHFWARNLKITGHLFHWMQETWIMVEEQVILKKSYPCYLRLHEATLMPFFSPLGDIIDKITQGMIEGTHANVTTPSTYTKYKKISQSQRESNIINHRLIILRDCCGQSLLILRLSQCSLLMLTLSLSLFSYTSLYVRFFSTLYS